MDLGAGKMEMRGGKAKSRKSTESVEWRASVSKFPPLPHQEVVHGRGAQEVASPGLLNGGAWVGKAAVYERDRPPHAPPQLPRGAAAPWLCTKAALLP